MRRLLYLVRRHIYEFVRDHIKPDPPEAGIRPEVGHIAFDAATWSGSYQGEVNMPRFTEGTDAVAFALIMQARWMACHAPDHGMAELPFKTGAFAYRVKFEVEFEPIQDAGTPTVYPGEITALLDMLGEAAANGTGYESEAEPMEGVVFQFPGGEE